MSDDETLHFSLMFPQLGLQFKSGHVERFTRLIKTPDIYTQIL